MAASMIFGLNQRRAFRKLICNCRERLYRMAYAWTHDPYLADDLVQQTIWLFRILSNCLKDHYRAKRDVVSPDNLVISDREAPEHMTEQQQLVEKVQNAVKQLPLAQCQVVTLVDLEGFAYASVANILDIPVGTVMSRLCRGRRALKDYLIDVRPGVQAGRTATLTRVK
jgi:RNA polymerase sigma-70 factor (ECF subfamily)